MVFGLRSAYADYTLNLMKGVTKPSVEIYDLHMWVLWVCVFIGIAVFGTMFYSIYYHRKSMGHEAAQFHGSTKVEIIWSIIPFVILVVMAVPATKLVLELDDVQDSELTIKITGWQWKWQYEYIDEEPSFFSNLDAASNEARQVGSGIDPRTIPNYLLEVDKPLVVPVDTKIRFLFTAGDVIHSWWVPDLGWKKDTIPGFISDAWTSVGKAGTYRGQCAELCGKGHGFMPIVVVAVSPDEYETWLEEYPDGGAGDYPAGTWSKKAGCAAEICTEDELLQLGQAIYNTNCASCHMGDGAGIAGSFPALTGSPIVTGDKAAQIALISNGIGMMPAFGAQLSATEMAAVTSFTRNDLGNSVGDWVQPSEINGK
jgi:cytochrome c oxidase subunit 2